MAQWALNKNLNAQLSMQAYDMRPLSFERLDAKNVRFKCLKSKLKETS